MQGTFKCINTDKTYRIFFHSNSIDIQIDIDNDVCQIC